MGFLMMRRYPGTSRGFTGSRKGQASAWDSISIRMILKGKRSKFSIIRVQSLPMLDIPDHGIHLRFPMGWDWEMTAGHTGPHGYLSLYDTDTLAN